MFKKRKKFIFLIDLDGVLNIFGCKDKRELKIIRNGANVWRIPVETIEFIKEISNRSDVELYWLSSWQEEANIINSEIGIKKFLPTNSILLPNKIKNLSLNNIKKEQIKYIKNKNKKSIVISIDDDFEDSEADFHICPNSSTGITNKEINLINNILS